MKEIEGESAFPHGPIAFYDASREDWVSKYAQQGMTLRQWYIGKALQGFCANSGMTREYSHDAIAAVAIHQADAVMSMLYPQPNEEPNQ